MRSRLLSSVLLIGLTFPSLLGCGDDSPKSPDDTGDPSTDEGDGSGSGEQVDSGRRVDAGRRDASTPTGNPGNTSSDAGAQGRSDAAAAADASSSTPDSSVVVTGDDPTVASASKAGPYKVGNTTDGLRDGPAYADATLFWPMDGTPPYAFVAVVPGFVSGQDTIKPWGPFLASHGIVAITIGTNTPTDQPDARAAALLDALKTVAAENTRDKSPLFGKLDLSRQATIGWSMGGGGSLLAAEQTPSLKAAISLCGWNPTYSYNKVTVPALLLAVQGDSLAGGQSQGFYDAIPSSTPKELWELANATAFFNGHDTFNDPASLSGAAGRYGLSWLKVFLQGDDRYRQFLKQEPAMKTDFKNNL